MSASSAGMGVSVINRPDPRKDQFLYHEPAPVGPYPFPLGEYHKSQVRAMAEEAGLPVAIRPKARKSASSRGDYGDSRGMGQVPPRGLSDPPTEIIWVYTGASPHHRAAPGTGPSLGNRFVTRIDPEMQEVWWGSSELFKPD